MTSFSRWARRFRQAMLGRYRSGVAFQASVAAEVLEDRLMLSGTAGEAAQPDFHLDEVSTTSSSFDTPVSPRDYLEQVSAWYFGHAT